MDGRHDAATCPTRSTVDAGAFPMVLEGVPQSSGGATMPTLRISSEKVCFVVVKARELDVKVAPEWMDDGSNPADDRMAQILEDYADDATLDELRSYLQALNDDELEDLLALTWLGRGDYTLIDWEDLMSEVQDVRDQRTVDYLIGTPLLADYLENGLSEFGLSCAEFELGRM
jgi:Protein of unknown function (DUF3775)